MKELDIRLLRETDSKKVAYQTEVISKLQQRLPKQIAVKFSDVKVRIRVSSSSGFDIKGFDKEEKKRFLEYLEELWNDDSLLE